MDRPTTRELYSQLQERLILNLEDNEVPCPVCKGLRFVLIESGAKSYIEPCRNCHTGKVIVCKHCGQGKKSWCDCEEAQEERSNDFELKQKERQKILYNKAKKIHYKDYDGRYILPNSDHIQDIDDVAEWIYERIIEDEYIPEYLWAVEPSPCVSIDIRDIISNECEDGYEDMYDNLDTESPLLSQAQELIDQWEEYQDDRLSVYDETHEKAVVIKDLIEEIRSEIEIK